MRAAATANAPQRSEDLGIQPGNPIANESGSSLPRTMSRPRKAEDPIRWPVPCARCRQHHQTVARWPDGGICGYCYQQAKRTKGTCACGHEGVLPGLIDQRPACRQCSGVRLNVDCEAFGAEDELHSGGRCWSCVLATVVDDLLTNPSTGVMAHETHSARHGTEVDETRQQRHHLDPAKTRHRLPPKPRRRTNDHA
jgi:hypothetical protein